MFRDSTACAELLLAAANWCRHAIVQSARFVCGTGCSLQTRIVKLGCEQQRSVLIT